MIMEEVATTQSHITTISNKSSTT